MITVNEQEKENVKNSLEKVLRSSEEPGPIEDILTEKPMVLSKDVGSDGGNSSFFKGKLIFKSVTVV